MKRALISLFVLVVCPAVVLAGTTGNLRGVVSDENKQPLPGVTVVATSPALQGEQATLTDEQGRYHLDGLPPGTYKVQFVFGEATTEQNGVVVYVDRTIDISAAVSTTAQTAEVHNIEEAAPNVDVASSTLGVTVTKDFVQNVPLGSTRNFEEALSVTPSAGGDYFGVGVGGATSPENAYVMDGVNTADPAFGLIGSRLVLDFIEEFDIKEGGYGAEFGRATGGFVNIVTKSGSNEFHGTVFAYYSPGWFELERKVVRRRGGDAIGTRVGTDYYLNPGFEVGGPIIPDKLWFHVGYAPELLSVNRTRRIFAQSRDPANPDEPLLDENQDVVTEAVGENNYKSLGVAHQFTSKLTFLQDENNRHELSFRGAPTVWSGVAVNDLDPNSPSTGMFDPQTFNFSQTTGNLDAVYHYAGEWFGDKLRVEGFVGWHHQVSRTHPDEASTSLPLIVYDYDRDLSAAQSGDIALPDECLETFADGTTRCRTFGYRKGGFGQGLVPDLLQLDRFTERLTGTNFFDFAGLHALKYGFDFEQNDYKSRNSYTGLGFYTDYGAGDIFLGQSFVTGDSDEPLVSISTHTQSRNWALFLQDSWNPVPTLTFNYGVRWEAQQLFGPKPDDRHSLEGKLDIVDNIAPRVGAIWDYLGNGRSKAFVHWGRFYESIPLDFAERGFAGQGLRIDYLDTEGCTDADGNPIDHEAVTNPLEQCPLLESFSQAATDFVIMPGIKSPYSDELTLGSEVELIPSYVFGITGIYRSLGRVMEDISVDPDATEFVVANPGEFDRRELDEIDRKIARESDPAKREALEFQRQKLLAINDYPKASRTFLGLQFTLDKKLSNNFLVRGSYLLSWTTGNYSGLYEDTTLQLNPHSSIQYDLPRLTQNLTGRLPQDRRHRFKVDGYYSADLQKDFGIDVPVGIVLGLSGRLSSGKPYNALGTDELYGDDAVFIIPRGKGGETPWAWSTDAHIAARYKLDETQSVEVFLELLNFTNNQEVVEVDEEYTVSVVRPVLNGTKRDLAHLRDINGQPVKKSPNWGKPITYQGSLQGQFGARYSF